jgi:hypothetical protein
MHDKELHNLYSSPNIGVTKSKMIMGEMGIAYKMFVKQPVETWKS